MAAETKVIKIGAVNSLTGFMAAGESPSDPGMKIAADWINDKGGITVKGVKYKVQLVTEDPKSSAEGMAAACIKLVEKEKVKFILGGVNPMMNIAASSVTEPANVLRVASYSVGNPDEINAKFPLTFFYERQYAGRSSPFDVAEGDVSQREDIGLPASGRRGWPG
jgi:ABC-type branched-subunit amino acid transport system substrate-binding protein